MDKVYIPDVENAPQQTIVLDVEEFFSELDSLTAVQGQITLVHQGNYLQVNSQAKTIVTLNCDRCLQQYNHRLTVDASEMIWLSADVPADEPGLEIEVTLDDPVETLSPRGYFSPEDWLYQQLSLQLPHRQLCDQACEGLLKEAEKIEQPVDRRWAALESLKEQMQGN
ncbi:YceD family protein [Acaryochloris sp. IP29b_bin.137]|uniref:YceD family protein n=1 Tax=Acaryochloris sp. IP29b_bin.137 TaxID=2969217 RepID=UPI002610C44A|nr:YceD family protein [Acaryochloris sp. IP29b_bin.137]